MHQCGVSKLPQRCVRPVLTQMFRIGNRTSRLVLKGFEDVSEQLLFTVASGLVELLASRC